MSESHLLKPSRGRGEGKACLGLIDPALMTVMLKGFSVRPCQHLHSIRKRILSNPLVVSPVRALWVHDKRCAHELLGHNGPNTGPFVPKQQLWPILLLLVVADPMDYLGGLRHPPSWSKILLFGCLLTTGQF